MMRTIISIHILLFLVGLTFSPIFSLQMTSSSTTRVLVIGGNGRVGSKIASKLLAQGTPTRILVRDLDRAKNDPNLAGCELRQGNVCSLEDVMQASKDCGAIISVHGVKPPRLSRIQDLYRHPRYDMSHPYNVNYIGIQNILKAMQEHRIQKLVRITGALVNKSPFSPFVALFNILLSKSNKWHEKAEIAIRESGVDYTVIRPTGIVQRVYLRPKKVKKSINETLKAPSSSSSRSDTEPLTAPTKLVMLRGDSKKGPKLPGQISVDNLADLCVLSLDSSQHLSRRTVVVSTEIGEGSNDWTEIIQMNQVS